ncbi:sigma-70 family RNA polymerase sigma factor [Streptomyces sp. NPDC058321]|uniref:sigma-70 family RNA polymerase sigma factor n=1 Tax=Streptomyces sp. NPDC058321 TaxID=3346445 RepID=UPI0036DFE046
MLNVNDQASQEEDRESRVLLLLGVGLDADLGEVTQRMWREIIASLSTFALSAAEREDLAAAAMLRFLERHQPAANPVAYMITIARRLAAKSLAITRAEQLTEDMTVIVSTPVHLRGGCEDEERNSAGPDDDELTQRSRRAVNSVPGQSGEVIRARLLDGLEPAEVARSTGRPRNQIYQEYRRGLAVARQAPEISPYIREAHVKRRRPSGDGDD